MSLRVELLDARGEVHVAVSTYRQDQSSHFLVRLNRDQMYEASQRTRRTARDSMAATVLAGLGPKADGAAVEQAVLKLHSRYQELEKIFD